MRRALIVAGLVTGSAACGFELTTVQPPIVDGPLADASVVDASTSMVDAAVDAPVSSCPPAYTAAHGTSRYRVGSASWYDAETACETDGAHLVRINSATENAFVLSLHPAGDIWIGLSDHLVEAQFRWTDGSATAGGYQNWQGGQPNDAGGSEDCGEMNVAGGWNDNGCTFVETYVCECDGAPPPTVPTWCQTGTQISCDVCNDRCDQQFDDDGECNASTQTCVDGD